LYCTCGDVPLGWFGLAQLRTQSTPNVPSYGGLDVRQPIDYGVAIIVSRLDLRFLLNLPGHAQILLTLGV
jgi:hypothetical protein